MKTFLGIDPGKGGGIAFSCCEAMEAHKMPETAHDLAELLGKSGLSVLAILERVQAMPPTLRGRRQGVSSAFKFGTNFGMIQGVLAALQIPYEFVTPTVWQRAMGCLTKGDKNVSKAKAQQLFPHLKIIHATADAVLLAEYGRRKYALTERERE